MLGQNLFYHFSPSYPIIEKNRLPRLGYALALVVIPTLLFGGCADQADNPRQKETSAAPVDKTAESLPAPPQITRVTHKVVDKFEVGTDVYVRALKVEEAAGSLWVGTSVGVHEIDLDDNSLKQTFTREQGLANEYVFAIGIDKSGNKWFGTNAGGASRYDGENWKTFFPMHGLADYWVYSFATQRDGTLWIGTWAGANRVDAKTGKFTTYIKELINEWVYGLAVDSRDRVWFGTEGGVSMFDGEQWHSWSHADGLGAGNRDNLNASKNTGLGTRSRHDLGVLSGGQATYNPNYVFSIHIAGDDVLWAGTWGGGVSRFDGGKWKNFTRDDGLAGNIVYSVTQDKEGSFWFGTNQGISRFDGNDWHNYGLYDGLPDLNVYTVAVAPNGDIWAGTKGAVLRLGKESIGN